MASRVDSAAMSALPLQRLAAATGLLLAAVTAVWWLGSARIVIERDAGGVRSAADALVALVLVRAMFIAALGPRIGALRGWGPAAGSGLGLVGPAWPIVLLAWFAGTASLAVVVMSESMLLGACIALPMLGVGLRRWLRSPELAVVAGTAVGIAVATALWLVRSMWTEMLF